MQICQELNHYSLPKYQSQILHQQSSTCQLSNQLQENVIIAFPLLMYLDYSSYIIW